MNVGGSGNAGKGKEMDFCLEPPERKAALILTLPGETHVGLLTYRTMR